MAEAVLPFIPGTVAGPMRIAAYGVLALPFLSFLLNGLWIGRKSGKASGWTATGTSG